MLAKLLSYRLCFNNSKELTAKDSRRILLPIERAQPAFWEEKRRAGLRFET
jgi:hypothetical protein